MPNPNCVAVWLDLMGTCEKLLLAGMRHRIGPDGDLRAEYRRWYEAQTREHDELLTRVCKRLHETTQEHGDAS
jgi:hypothetical protein